MKNTHEPRMTQLEYSRITKHDNLLLLFPMKGKNFYFACILDFEIFDWKIMNPFDIKNASIEFDDSPYPDYVPVCFEKNGLLTDCVVEHERFNLKIGATKTVVRNNRWGSLCYCISRIHLCHFLDITLTPPTEQAFTNFIQGVKYSFDYDSLGFYTCIGGLVKTITYQDKGIDGLEAKSENYARKIYQGNFEENYFNEIIDKRRFFACSLKTANIVYVVVYTLDIKKHIAWSAERNTPSIIYFACIWYNLNLSSFEDRKSKERLMDIIDNNNKYAYYECFSVQDISEDNSEVTSTASSEADDSDSDYSDKSDDEKPPEKKEALTVFPRHPFQRSASKEFFRMPKRDEPVFQQPYVIADKHDTIFEDIIGKDDILVMQFSRIPKENTDTTVLVSKDHYARILSTEANFQNYSSKITRQFFVHDVSAYEVQNQRFRITQKERNLIFTSLGMHKLSNPVTLLDSSLSKSLGYKEEITDLLELINPADKATFQDAYDSKTSFRLRAADGTNIWYSMISNGDDMYDEPCYIYKSDASSRTLTLPESYDSPLFKVIGSMFGLWTIDIVYGTILYQISPVPNLHSARELSLLLTEEDRIVFFDILKNMTEQVQQHRILQAKFTGEYLWYDVTFVMTAPKTVLVYVIDVNKETNANREIDSIQEQVNLALYQTKISEWSLKSSEFQQGEYNLNPMNLSWTEVCNKMSAADLQQLNEDIKYTLSTGHSFSREIQYLPNKWLTVRGCVVDKHQHFVVGITYDSTELMLIKQDLETQKKTALEASMAKSSFVANMSHEIRAPLQGMFAVLELLNMSNMNEEVFIHVKNIKNSFTHLLDLLNNILDLAKLESQRMFPSYATFNLLSILEPLLISARTMLDDSPIHLIPDIPPQMPLMFYGDPHFLTRIIENFLSNAVKFTEKGLIIVTAESTDDSLSISVTDTGIGINKEKMDVLFNAFEGLSYEGTRQFGGTCVGLAVALSMIELVGGKIAVKSKPGEGSTFTAFFPYEPTQYRFVPKQFLDIPLQIFVAPNIPNDALDKYAKFYGVQKVTRVEDANENLWIILIQDTPEHIKTARSLMKKFSNAETFIFTVKSEGQKEKLPEGMSYVPYLFLPSMAGSHFYEAKLRKKQKRNSRRHNTGNKTLAKVLLADDNPTNQIVMSKILDKIGCQHQCVGTGRQAIEALEKNVDNEFDIIIMDMRMPDMDGPSATRLIRQSDKPYKNVPIVAITASILKEDEEMCLNAGMNAFLTKPISMNRLSAVIKENAHK